MTINLVALHHVGKVRISRNDVEGMSLTPLSTLGFDTPPLDQNELTRRAQPGVPAIRLPGERPRPVPSINVPGAPSSPSQFARLQVRAESLGATTARLSLRDPESHQLREYIRKLISSGEELPQTHIPEDEMKEESCTTALRSHALEQRQFISWCWSNLFLLGKQLDRSSKLHASVIREGLASICRAPSEATGELKQHMVEVCRYFRERWRVELSIVGVSQAYLTLIALESAGERKPPPEPSQSKSASKASGSRPTAKEAATPNAFSLVEKGIIGQALYDALRERLRSVYQPPKKDKQGIESHYQKLDRVLLNPVTLLVCIEAYDLWHLFQRGTSMGPGSSSEAERSRETKIEEAKEAKENGNLGPISEDAMRQILRSYNAYAARNQLPMPKQALNATQISLLAASAERRELYLRRVRDFWQDYEEEDDDDDDDDNSDE